MLHVSSSGKGPRTSRRIFSSPEQVVSEADLKTETVILVHGLWTPAAIFVLHGRWLREQGYRVLRFGYPGVRGTLSQNALRLRRFIAAQTAADGAAGIHQVGHSLGGLVILDLLRLEPDSPVRRAVLPGTPCVNSQTARTLAGLPGMPALLGRSIIEWLSRPSGAAVASRPGIEVGVVAGTRSVGLGRVVPGLPRPNDGVVAVAETRLACAADSISLPVAHSEMLASRRCAAQVAVFLATGRFRHDDQG
jgi:pimeloyl-ACP methyl ester carboxylesterase